jgi:hypothetical protein
MPTFVGGSQPSIIGEPGPLSGVYFFGIEYIFLRHVWGAGAPLYIYIYIYIYICLSDCLMSFNGTCGSSIRGFGFLSDYVGRGVSHTLPHVGRSLVQRLSLVHLFNSWLPCDMHRLLVHVEFLLQVVLVGTVPHFMYCNLLSLVLGVVSYYGTGLLFVLAIKQVAPEQLCIVVRAHFMRYHVASSGVINNSEYSTGLLRRSKSTVWPHPPLNWKSGSQPLPLCMSLPEFTLSSSFERSLCLLPDKNTTMSLSSLDSLSELATELFFPYFFII